MNARTAVAKAARSWASAGFSVVPIVADGSKRPAGRWKDQQIHATSLEEINNAFSDGAERSGLGLVTGYRDTECLDFESADVWAAYQEAAGATGLGDLLNRVAAGYSERTPGGGVHLIYRSQAVEGNVKLAEDPANPDKKVLIETRGRGGFVVVAPSNGRVHHSGKPYKRLAGSAEMVAEISVEERADLFSLARTFDRRPPKPPRPEATRHVVDGARPGDNFNRHTAWAELLEPVGWTAIYEVDGITHWRRPGKEVGTSATTNYGGSDLLYVFSTSTQFEAERSYDKFGAYALLHHNGDYAAAARVLMDEGYGEAEGQELFRRYSAAEMAKEPPPFEWVVKSLLVRPTYGVIAGEKKSLKTYLALAIALGVAAGAPVLDHFGCRKPAHVHIYVGEGGQVPYQRRLQRIAKAYGVNLADLPITVSFETAPLDGSRFLDTLRRDIQELNPALVIVDPLYAFHSTKVNASNLYERGAMLNMASGVAADAEVSLLIVDHFNKSGSGTGLERISQAGMGEWADTWLLLSHRKPPDLEEGEFHLMLEVGSRQWGGQTYEVMFQLGAFDEETGDHVGAIEWAVVRTVGLPPTGRGSPAARRTESAIFKVLDDVDPYTLTRTEIKGFVKGNAERFESVFDDLLGQMQIVVEKRPRDEKGKPRTRSVVARMRKIKTGAGQPVPESGERVGPG